MTATTKARTLPLTKRGMSFETFMWLFTRLTALAMYGFIFVGIVGALMMGAQNDMSFVEVLRWALMPNVGHVTYTDVPDLAPWVTTFWKVVACGFFLTAVGHGIHGVIVILDDYFATEKQRLWIRILNIGVFLVIAPIGLYVIWTA
jgi:succinate dehydrogenase hydrophobic anchor subunit